MNNWTGIIICLVIFATIIFGMIMYGNAQGEIRECLKPYAEDICLQRDSIYIWNSDFVVRCKEDIRLSGSQTYLFTEEEMGACS